MSDSLPTPEDVLFYYGASDEADRLARGVGALEFERTKEIISRFLEPQASVADIGGAVGRYAEWLAQAGHRVELIEPVPLHLELARERAGDPPRFGVHRADARALPFNDQSFDAVLLLGPLYHLGDEHDRAQALREATRVCRRGGLIFAAAISRFAGLLDNLRAGRIRDDQRFANIQAETLTGRRVSAERRMSPFPDAYFHLPSDLESELAAAELDVHGVYGVEGLGWLLDDLDAVWEDDDARERMLSAARGVESERHVVGLSAHLLGVAVKAARSAER